MLLTDIIVSILAGAWKKMYFQDIVTVWAFSIGAFLFVDSMKVLFFCVILGEETGAVISFEEFLEASDDSEEAEEAKGKDEDHDDDVEAETKTQKREMRKKKRQSVHAKNALTEKEKGGHEEKHVPNTGVKSWFGFHRARPHHPSILS